jgi:enoyl-CoA hydratase/carnithine racemase
MSDLVSTLQVERSDHVLTVTLNRPAQRNAFNWAMRYELRDLWAGVRDDPDVRCVVVTGAGTAFCSGIDVSDLDDERRPSIG